MVKEMTEAEKSFEEICKYATDFYGPCLSPQEIQCHIDVVSAALKAQEKPVEMTVEEFDTMFYTGEGKLLSVRYPNGIKIIAGGEH